MKKRKAPTSRFRGVCAHPRGGWRARFQRDEVRFELGVYADEEQAARVYDRTASRAYGDKAKLNFPKALKRRRRRAP
jgi:hypothetical protein